MADVSPSIVPGTAVEAKSAAGDTGVSEVEPSVAEGEIASSALDSDTNQGGLFGGWGMPALPDINKVADGIGGMFNEIVDGADGAYDAAVEKSVDANSGGSEVGDGGEDLQKAAVDMATGATKELEKASKVAQQAIGHAAEDFGKGWGKLNHFLDDILAPGSRRGGGGGADADAEDLAEDEDVQTRFHSLFPDLEEEDVIDHYKCTLLQKYRCYLNNDTPEKSLAVRGRLFVSTTHLAMYIFDDGGAFDGAKFHVSVPLADVARVQKGAKSMMRVITSTQSSYIFADFESETHFTGALSLVEHIIESNLSAPDEAEVDGEVDGDGSAAETSSGDGAGGDGEMVRANPARRKHES